MQVVEAGLIIGAVIVALGVGVIFFIKSRQKDKDDNDENLLGGGSIRSHRPREL